MSIKSKITSLAVLRGIAVLSVCFCHLAKPVSKGTVLPEFFRWIGEYGQYGVHIFFVISGFVIPFSLYKAKYEIIDYFRFLYKRLLRLHPPYLLALSITLIVSAASYRYRHIANPETPFTIFKSLFYAHAPLDNPVFWTLRIEAEYYIFMGVFFVMISKFTKITILLGIPVLLFASQTNMADYIGLLKYLVFFLMGTIGYLIYIKEKFPILETLVLIALVIFSFWFYQLAAVIAASLTILMILFYRKPVKSVLEFPGEISYSLYLVHFPVGMKIMNFLQHHVGPSYYWTLFFIVTFICFLSGWLFWQYIEKPSARLSNDVKYGQARVSFKNFSLK